MKKVLLTTVCRPLGPNHGDGPSVGYELLFGQVTRAQGIFSPRATHLHFGLDYIAHNLETPTTVLQFPSKSELIRELRKGYDYVGINFILSTFHKMKDVSAIVREHAPGAKIVLGGYGTVLKDSELERYGDIICRGEGVAFMRELLGEVRRVKAAGGLLRLDPGPLCRAAVLATGSSFLPLGLPGERRLEGRGLYHAPFESAPDFKGKVVGVVGGGEAAAHQALLLARYAKKVYLLCRGPGVKAVAPLQAGLEKSRRVELMTGTRVRRLLGARRLGGVELGDGRRLGLDALFVLVGKEPRLPRVTGRTPAVFTAGDARAGSFRQVAIAAADGMARAMECERYLRGRKREG